MQMPYGWTYALSNPAKPGVLKIGKTTGALAARVRAHNAMLGIEADDLFSPVFAALGPDPRGLEQEVHSVLAFRGKRLGSRELFRASVEEAREAFAKALPRFPHQIVERDWAAHEGVLAVGADGRAIPAKRLRARPPTLCGWMMDNWDRAVELMGDWSEERCRALVVAYDGDQQYRSSQRLSLTPLGVRDVFKRARREIEGEQRRRMWRNGGAA